MAVKKEWMAMLLAGGQGSRLYALTQNLAKPAVPYGGKYRIIDFPLSNCVNSGIDTVGVLTQYQPLVLNEYIGNGQPWDLDRMNGGVFVLPPYQKSSGSDWYTGTANAIYQNKGFIERYTPDNVVILSGDHIYKMDYSRMLRFHKEKGADCTIAVINVPIEEARRFGIVVADSEAQILQFEEKPKHPKSTLASMGVYIFRWDKLRAYLDKDCENKSSHNDFGKDLVPAMLAAGERLFAYSFEGYWKDVGTVESLWQANMDLLNPGVPLELYDPTWRIYSRNPALPPQYVGGAASIQNSMVAEGCYINGNIDFSIIFAGVYVEKGAEVRDSIVMPGAVIKAGAVVEYSIIAERAVIEAGAHVGGFPTSILPNASPPIAVVAEGVTIGPGAVVAPGAMQERDIPGVEVAAHA